MKKLLANIMLLVVTPVFAQEVVSPYPPAVIEPVANQTYTLDTTNVPLQNVQQDGTPVTLYDDGNTRVNLPFEFYFFGNPYSSINISQNGYISFTSNSQGCCDGQPLPNFDLSNPYFDTRNSIFALWNDLADFNNPGNPYIKSFNDRFVVGWYNIEELGTQNKFNFEITLFKTSYDFSINYGNMTLSDFREWERFTVGFQGDTQSEVYQIYYGNDPSFLSNTTYTFVSNYNYTPQFLYWDRLTGENGEFTLTEPGVVRYGADGVYVYKSLEAGTYSCSNGFWGDPIGGVVKSCELGSNELPVVAVDCTINPSDPSCIINSFIDTGVVDPVEQAIADATTDTSDNILSDGINSNDGSSDGTDIIEESEEILVTNEIIEEKNLEEVLQSEEVENEEVLVVESSNNEVVAEKTTATESTTASVSSIADESKASELADSISKSVLEGALSIAADATTASSNAAQSSSTSDSSKTTSGGGGTSSSTMMVQETISNENKTEESRQDNNDSSVAAMDLLETGRQMGIAALATTLADTALSATDSVNQAESVSVNSSENSTTTLTGIDIRTETSNTLDSVSETDIVSVEIQNASTTEDISIAYDTIVVNDQTTNDQVDNFNDIMNLEIKPVTEDVDADLEFVQQLTSTIAQKSAEEEANNSGFSEAEAITIYNDPALANAFNVLPSVSNLEITGVIGQKQEEKSDAEKRADEVVAANAKEQEEINKNYMDADQSGIVAAMGADTDVGAYRSAMLQDNNTWYKPEDIYKNVVYKDNVRGAYFLEKGNTDTYKKMVEEQYK